MAKIQHKSYNQNDSLLFPPCLGDFIEDNRKSNTSQPMVQ